MKKFYGNDKSMDDTSSTQNNSNTTSQTSTRTSSSTESAMFHRKLSVLNWQQKLRWCKAFPEGTIFTPEEQQPPESVIEIITDPLLAMLSYLNPANFIITTTRRHPVSQTSFQTAVGSPLHNDSSQSDLRNQTSSTQTPTYKATGQNYPPSNIPSNTIFQSDDSLLSRTQSYIAKPSLTTTDDTSHVMVRGPITANQTPTRRLSTDINDIPSIEGLQQRRSVCRTCPLYNIPEEECDHRKTLSQRSVVFHQPFHDSELTPWEPCGVFSVPLFCFEPVLPKSLKPVSNEEPLNAAVPRKKHSIHELHESVADIEPEDTTKSSTKKSYKSVTTSETLKLTALTAVSDSTTSLPRSADPIIQPRSVRSAHTVIRARSAISTIPVTLESDKKTEVEEKQSTLESKKVENNENKQLLTYPVTARRSDQKTKENLNVKHAEKPIKERSQKSKIKKPLAKRSSMRQKPHHWGPVETSSPKESHGVQVMFIEQPIKNKSSLRSRIVWICLSVNILLLIGLFLTLLSIQ